MRSYLACFIAIACLTTACTRPTLSGSAQVQQPAPQVALLELWSDPTDLAQRDLLWGSSRKANAPSKDDVYTVLALDTTGYSKGYDVKGPDGREWDIKVGKEVQSEMVLSRILWALGYHQPETYYVTGWQLTGTWDQEGEPARFRLQSDHENESEWAWRDNPFAGTRPLQGLIAINLLLNNHDLKTSNNRVYRLTDARAEPRSSICRPGRGLFPRKAAWTSVLQGHSKRHRRLRSTQSDQEGQRLESSTRLSRPARRHPRGTQPGRRDLGVRADESTE